ncbi:TlpA disulfide reductase family protein [Xanthomonas sp. XNM01]|uniref:redoxin family protein n=1 Tax=Xanthomonas sp. XNM01 TaxID=2769289 RepID=UPI00178539DA|nr:TlpA family protein disulfide reductase [Xanthomonas sp. XNM01]
MRPALRLVVVAVAAGALGVLAGTWHGRHGDPDMPAPPPGVTAAEPGDAMPPVQLPGLDGTPVDLVALAAGRPLLINVWASWCGPCIEEMPELERFSREQGDTGIQVIGLALDTPEAVADFLQRVPVGYPIVLDTPGPADASVRLGNTRGLLPYTVLIDADRRVVRRKLGPFAHGEIDGWVR